MKKKELKGKTFGELADVWAQLPDRVAENAAGYFLGLLTIQVESNPNAKLGAAREALAAALEKFG